MDPGRTDDSARREEARAKHEPCGIGQRKQREQRNNHCLLGSAAIQCPLITTAWQRYDGAGHLCYATHPLQSLLVSELPRDAVPPTRWSGAMLDALRQVADPETDAIAAEVFQTGGPAALGRLTQQLEDWEAPIAADMPLRVREWFNTPVDYPAFDLDIPKEKRLARFPHDNPFSYYEWVMFMR